jgi:hypothetical protein
MERADHRKDGVKGQGKNRRKYKRLHYRKQEQAVKAG